ncbi:MAG: TlyA family RNA methyltransferase [Leptospiraceae bacterium]|nr:TlyA family RNA methyltransferase [Leptospiraceae bacterium]
MPKEKRKISEILVERGLATSLEHAEALLLSGSVLVNDVPVTKKGFQFPIDVSIRIRENISHNVSRGVEKLKPILEKWNISVQNKVCIDLGASTGGFTQVLLEKGAKSVYAVDVGYGQLAYKLQKDNRVKVLDRTHYKKLNWNRFTPLETHYFITIDLSFTSIVPVFEKIQKLYEERREILLEGVGLIKPQFEAKREELEKGVVKDSRIRFQILKRILRKLKKIKNLRLIKLTRSPILGTEGNQEFFIYFQFISN